MGKARQLLDQMTQMAVEQHNVDGAMELYAEDAVVIAPDVGEVRGREQIAEFWHGMTDGFPDGHYESTNKLEVDGKAVDEGYFVGTHTGTLRSPDGETIEATGRKVRLRSCDIATVQGGKITEHHVYFDDGEFMRQLGLNG